MPYDTLPEFLVKAPLYQPEPFPAVKMHQYQSGTNYIEAPELLDRACDKCGLTKWRLDQSSSTKVAERSITHLRYHCRNCTEAVFSLWVMWHRPGVTIVKAGQYPKLEITIPKEFGEALGDKRPLYMKGMTLRHNAYGIGAITYFRRTIEDTTDEMLDLLEETMNATGADSEALATLKRAKGGTRFEDKVKIAAQVLPANLRPNNINPFGDLYELLSIGLHDRTDAECCEIVDAMDESLKFIYTQLKTHMEVSKGYQSSTHKVGALLAKMKKGGSG